MGLRASGLREWPGLRKDRDHAVEVSVNDFSVEESPALAPALPLESAHPGFPGCLPQPVAASQAILALV